MLEVGVLQGRLRRVSSVRRLEARDFQDNFKVKSSASGLERFVILLVLESG